MYSLSCDLKYLHMYIITHSIEEFAAAIEEVKNHYQVLPPETQSESIIADFDARWKKGQHDFLNRPSRYFY